MNVRWALARDLDTPWTARSYVPRLRIIEVHLTLEQQEFAELAAHRGVTRILLPEAIRRYLATEARCLKTVKVREAA